jgi:hypothetical protein
MARPFALRTVLALHRNSIAMQAGDPELCSARAIRNDVLVNEQPEGQAMTNSPDEMRDEIENLKIGQATQAATLAGFQATQAAVTAGAQATQAAATAGTMATMIAGSVALIVGLFLGITLRR